MRAKAANRHKGRSKREPRLPAKTCITSVASLPPSFLAVAETTSAGVGLLDGDVADDGWRAVRQAETEGIARFVPVTVEQPLAVKQIVGDRRRVAIEVGQVAGVSRDGERQPA